MPTTIFQDRLNGDPSFSVFKKSCEVVIDRAYNELKAGRDVKGITITSEEIQDNKVIKCCVWVELLGELKI